jgi:hypothetical protein
MAPDYGPMSRNRPRLLSFDRSFVAYWSRQYVEDDKSVGGKEQELFTRVGPQVAKRGYYQKAEMAMVGDWKSPRIRSRLARNPDEDVRDISRLALAAPERLQHRILSLLRMESGILSRAPCSQFGRRIGTQSSISGPSRPWGSCRASAPSGKRCRRIRLANSPTTPSTWSAADQLRVIAGSGCVT